MVRVVAVVIPEHSNANCFVLSESSRIRKPLSFVVIPVEVKEVNPARVVEVAPRAIDVEPTVIELF